MHLAQLVLGRPLVALVVPRLQHGLVKMVLMEQQDLLVILALRVQGQQTVHQVVLRRLRGLVKMVLMEQQDLLVIRAQQDPMAQLVAQERLEINQRLQLHILSLAPQVGPVAMQARQVMRVQVAPLEQLVPQAIQEQQEIQEQLVILAQTG